MADELRKIIHIDMDAFYASVEQRDDPSLRGKPVVVGGSPSGRGVVASASYEARRFGIRSAMSASRARSLCPATIFVRPNFYKYKEVSRRIREMFFEVTDLVEPLSLDEAYLDVTVNKLREPLATKIAVQLRARIRAELQLTASAGVAPNKFLAKLASDLKKPDGLCVITPERVSDVLECLPVEKLWGVGPATARKLKTVGLHTTREIRSVRREFLLKFMGSFGGFIFDLAEGRDSRRVKAEREPKSRGSETTFESDVLDLEHLRATVRELCEDVVVGLQKFSGTAQTVTVKVRYRDFKTVTRSRTFERGTDLIDEINVMAQTLLDATHAGKIPVRLVGVSLSKLRSKNSVDKSLEVDPQLFLDLG